MIMTKVTYEDEYLFSLLKQGNQDAFTQLYNKYSSMLYGLSYRYLQDRNLAEDVVQQVFLHLWEVHSTCHIKVHLRNYLYTMTKNYLLNMIRDTNDIIAREDMKGTEQNNIIDDGLQEKLEEERDNLINVERPRVIEELQLARSQGDLSENADYDAALDQFYQSVETKYPDLTH